MGNTAELSTATKIAIHNMITAVFEEFHAADYDGQKRILMQLRESAERFSDVLPEYTQKLDQVLSLSPEQLSDKSAESAAATGAVVGGLVGAAIGSVAPGVGTYAGAAGGAAVGSVIGTLIWALQ